MHVHESKHIWRFPVYIFYITIFFGSFYFDVLSVIGWLFVFLGFILYVRTRRFIGSYYCTVPAIKKGHRLIREGPYSYVRHPIYLSSFIVIMGFIMISKSIFSLVYCIFICIPYGLYKISLEEEILEKRFGKSFRTYKKNTPMILPTLKSFNREK